MYRNKPHVKHTDQQQTSVGQTQTYYVQHDFDGPAKLTTTLAHGFRLNDHVDPDALDRLFKPKDDGTFRMNGHLSFTIWGYQATVYSDGQIAIVPPQQPQQQQQVQQPQR